MSNKDNNNQTQRQALELLPLYTLGLLEVEDKQFVEKALLEFPELQEQLETEHEMVRHLREEKETFSLSTIEDREERLRQLLKKEEFQPEKPEQQEAKINTKLPEFFQALFSGGMSKPQYMGFAAITTLSIALLFAFTVPLLESESTFYPAASESDEGTPEKNSLLIGLSVAPDDPKLLKLLNNNDIKTATIAEKDGMYRLSFTKKKPNAADLEKLLSTLSKETELIWFVGEAY